MATKTLLTVGDFLELPAVQHDDYNRYELWQGELVKMGETCPWHNWVRDEIRTELQIFLRRNRLGAALCEAGIQLDSITLYRPDVALWDAEHWAAVDLRQSPMVIVPQLVVEVKSPSNSLPELFGKASYYLRSGVQTVWVVIDEPFAIHIFESKGGRGLVQAGEMLTSPTTLPGFSIEASRLLPAT